MGERSGQPDLVGVHRDAASARRSIERLSRAGIDGGAIELLGPVEVVTDSRYGDRQTDLGSSLAIGGRFARALGIGAIFGAVFGAIVLALSTDPSMVALSAGAAGGAVFGAGVGMLTGLLATPTMVRSWERTFSPLVPGGVLVGVRVEKERAGRRARRVLAGNASAITEVDDLDLLPEATRPSERSVQDGRDRRDDNPRSGPGESGPRESGPGG